MVCYDFCAGFALRALCWEVWEDCIDLEGGVGQGDEKKVFLGGEAGEGGGGGCFWSFLGVLHPNPNRRACGGFLH